MRYLGAVACILFLLMAGMSAAFSFEKETPFLKFKYSLLEDTNPLHMRLSTNLNFSSVNPDGSEALGPYWDMGAFNSKLYQTSADGMEWLVRPMTTIEFRKVPKSKKEVYAHPGYTMERQAAKTYRITSLYDPTLKYTFVSGRRVKYDFGKLGVFNFQYADASLLQSVTSSNGKIAQFEYCNVGEIEKRVKSVIGQNGRIDFDYGEFEIYDADGKKTKCFLVKRIKFFNGDNIVISYGTDERKLNANQSLKDNFPKNWKMTSDGERKLNVFDVLKTESGKTVRRIYKWDVETGALAEANGKNYICAFDPKNKPLEEKTDGISASYQITEYDSDYKEVSTRRWEGAKGLLTRIKHRKNMMELQNYIVSSGYGGMALRRTSILKDGKSVFEEQFVYDDKYNVVRKLQTKNGVTEIVDLPSFR